MWMPHPPALQLACLRCMVCRRRSCLLRASGRRRCRGWRRPPHLNRTRPTQATKMQASGGARSTPTSTPTLPTSAPGHVTCDARVRGVWVGGRPSSHHARYCPTAAWCLKVALVFVWVRDGWRLCATRQCACPVYVCACAGPLVSAVALLRRAAGVFNWLSVWGLPRVAMKLAADRCEGTAEGDKADRPCVNECIRLCQTLCSGNPCPGCSLHARRAGTRLPVTQHRCLRPSPGHGSAHGVRLDVWRHRPTHHAPCNDACAQTHGRT